jgi:hypothetical protein
VSWEELKRTLAETVSLLPASDEEHEARLAAQKDHGRPVEYLRRPNYCGGWDRWKTRIDKRSGEAETVRERVRCMNPADGNAAQCSYCHGQELDEIASRRTQKHEEREQITRKATAAKVGRYVPKGMT